MFWKVLAKTGRLWWQYWIAILLLNILWFLLQIPLVTAPTATATFFSIGKKVIQGELWDWKDLYQTWIQLFWPSWKWGALNLIVILAIVGNFYLYAFQVGVVWSALRIFWGIFFAAWVFVNLIYWPFWLIQSEPSLQNTFGNAFRFILLNPMTSIGSILLFALLGTIGTVFVLPLPFGVVGFFVLFALLLVEEAINQNH